jgi:hypothetical protein
LELIEHKTAEVQAAPFPKIPSTNTCNGKIHRQERYCKRPAGWGTSHPGEGRCKLHGGCCTGPKSGQLRYSDFVPEDLVEKYEEFAAEPDVDIKSLNDEIALIRSKITRIEQLNSSGLYDKQICGMVELIRRLTETKQKVEEGIKSHITIEIVNKVINDVIEIIDRRVGDTELKKSIATDMRRIHLTEALNNLN